MFIRRDNTKLTVDGRSVWAITKGTYSMPLDSFIEEIESFDRRLIETMGERVQAIRRSWDRPLIKIDKEALLRERQLRAKALAETFQRCERLQADSMECHSKSNHIFRGTRISVP